MKAAANMVALQEDFSRTQLRDAVAVDGGRPYGETIRIGIGNDASYVRFYLSDKSPLGCRFVARGLVLLARLAGGVAQLPEQICFIASGRPWGDYDAADRQRRVPQGIGCNIFPSASSGVRGTR